MSSLISAIFSGNVTVVIMLVIARAIVVFLCLPVHELCHGLAAYKLGDDTAKKMGRLSFNPVSYTHLTLPTICSV